MNIYPSGNMALMAGGGNVGIGTTAPAVFLDVSGSTGEIARFAGSAGISNVNYLTVGGRAMFGYDGTSQNAAVQGIAAKGIEFNVNNATFGSGTAVVINTSGNMGIGTTTPGTPLEVSGSQAFRISELGGTQNPYMEWTRSGVRQAYMGYGTPGSSFYIAREHNHALTVIATATTVYGNMSATGNITFTQANSLATSTDLNTVIANGHYRLGGTPVNSPGAGALDYGQMIVSRGLDTILQIGGDYLSNNLYFRGGNPSNIGGSGSWAAWRKVLYDGMGANVSIAGNITASAFLYSSDKRLKSDVTTLTGGLAKLDALNPVSFRFTADPNKTIHLGLIAQDVQKVYPEAIHADDKGFLKLDYPALIGPMVGMLKEMKQRVLVNGADIAKLQAANDNLELRITDLHKQVHALKEDNDRFEAANKTLKAANDNAMRRLDVLERRQRAHGW